MASEKRKGLGVVWQMDTKTWFLSFFSWLFEWCGVSSREYLWNAKAVVWKRLLSCRTDFERITEMTHLLTRNDGRVMLGLKSRILVPKTRQKPRTVSVTRDTKFAFPNGARIVLFKTVCCVGFPYWQESFLTAPCPKQLVPSSTIGTFASIISTNIT